MAHSVRSPLCIPTTRAKTVMGAVRPAFQGSWHRPAYGLTFHTTRSCVVRAGGAGVADAPAQTTVPERGTESSYKRPPIYKVFLHNDNYNKREYVVKVLLKVVDAITMDDAVVVMQEAHETGVALVVACPQENAERYCEGLRLNGLTSTIEPASR